MFLVLASGMNYTEQQVHLYKVFFFFFRQSVSSGLKDCSRKLYSAVIPKFFLAPYDITNMSRPQRLVYFI